MTAPHSRSGVSQEKPGSAPTGYDTAGSDTPAPERAYRHMRRHYRYVADIDPGWFRVYREGRYLGQLRRDAPDCWWAFPYDDDSGDQHRTRQAAARALEEQ